MREKLDFPKNGIGTSEWQPGKRPNPIYTLHYTPE